MSVSERQRLALLTEIDRLVTDKFYDPLFKGHNWTAIVEEHRPNVLSSAETHTFETATNQMLGKLGSSGLGLISAGTRITSKNSISATFREVATKYGHRWVFQDVHTGGPAAAAGIVSGDILTHISNVEVVPPDKPLFSMGRTHELTIHKTSGPVVVTISVPQPKYKDNPCAVPDTATVSKKDGVIIVKVPLFPGKLGIDFARNLSRAFESQVDKGERLVLDLRGNPGGGVGCLRLMSLLTPGREPIGFSLDRSTALRGYDKTKLPFFDRLPSSKLEVPLLALRFAGKKSVVLFTESLGPRAFHGRIVVLVNEHTTCASEMVALFAREQLSAIIIGAPTPGRLVTHTGFNLGHGFTLALPVAGYLSWIGTRLDGPGITPDELVEWSCQDVNSGIDRQLMAAITKAAAL